MTKVTIKYEVVNLDDRGWDWDDVTDDFLEGWGDDGWELCGILRTGLIFKRRREE